MRTLKELLPRIQRDKQIAIDEKTIFHVARCVLIEEYGTRGGENIVPTFYKDKKLFLSPRSSLWASEVYLMREKLVREINTMLGSDEVREIKITQQA